MTSNLLFNLFSLFLVLNSLLVIISKHPVFSLLFLVGCFINSSFLLILLESEFLAFIFLIIYVGAIAILFLFAVMMLEAKAINLSRNVLKYIPISFIFVFCLLIPLLIEILNNFNSNFFKNSFLINNYQNWFDLVDSLTDIEIFGQLLYSYFVLHFLVAGFILLLVIICVVFLTKNFKSNQINEQLSFKQLSRTFTL